MYFYIMKTSKKRLIQQLDKLRRERGLTQGELASHLGVSQPHLSRVMSGAMSPGNKLEFRITRLLDTKSAKNADEWIDRVKQAAERSPAFRRLTDAALEL